MNKKLPFKTVSLLFVVLTIGIASSLSLIGGLGIEIVEEQLFAIAPLVIALPALNSMVGDYATLIAAHAGNPNERRRSKRDLVRAMTPSVIVNIIFILMASLWLAHYRHYIIESVFLIKFSGFVIISVIAIIAVMFLITIVLDKVMQKRRLNPDDILIPIVTSISDIFMLGLIALAAWLLF